VDTQKRVAIVIPIYNEAKVIELFHHSLVEVIDHLPQRFSIYYVNDGSTDGSDTILERLVQADQRVTVIELSRNFGHQAALTAGLDMAEGDYVISMDGDGQHPPAMLPRMIELADAGYDIVLTQRMEQEGLSEFKKTTSSVFYSLINRLGNTHMLEGGADFRLMARSAVDALRGMREYHRFLRGMVSWMGFRTVILPFQPAARLAGESKYSLKKMLRLAQDAVFSFSLVPLYIGISIGGLFLVLALLEAIYVLSFWVSGNTASLAPGWSSLMFVLLVTGGFIMVILGLIGVYIGHIFQEVKRRPIYLVRTTTSKEN
jgi:polyisoprenyl-phosphate glycosyltransferase